MNKLTTEQLDQIEAIFDSAGENSSLFFSSYERTINNEKYLKKEQNAIKSYANEINSDEIVILFDDTVFGSAKEGFILTSQALYFKELAKDGCKIKFDEVKQASSSKKNKIKIDTYWVNMTMLNENTNAIVDILNKLIKFNNSIEAKLSQCNSAKEMLELAVKIAFPHGYTEDYYMSSSERENFIKTVKLARKSNPTFQDLRRVASLIYDESFPGLINDINWAREVYEELEKKITTPEELDDLQSDVYNFLGDESWSRRLLIQIDPLFEVKDWLRNINDVDGYAKALLNSLEPISTGINIHKFTAKAENFFDYDFPDAKKYAIMLIKQIQPYASTFKEYVDIGCTITNKDYINDKVWAKEIFDKADDLADDASLKMDLAEPVYDYHKDGEWGRELLGDAEEWLDNHSNFNDYMRLAILIESADYADDKVWAREIYQKVLDINPDSSDYIKLCEIIANRYNLNDKVWAKELIKKHIAFEDQVRYKKIINLASNDDMLADAEFTKEIVKNAKEQCNGFDDYLDLLNKMHNGSRATEDMLEDTVFDTIEVLENDDQKEQLIDSIGFSINENIVEMIKTKSINELKKIYGKEDDNSNNFSEELTIELPPIDVLNLSFKEKIKNADYIELYEIFKEIESLKETLEDDEYRSLHQELYNASLGLVSYSGYERVVTMVSAISHYSQEEMPLEKDLVKAMWMMSQVPIRLYYESIDEEFNFENIEYLYNLGKIQAVSAFIAEDDSPMYRFWMKDIGLKTISDDDTELIANALLYGFFLLTEKASIEIQEKYQEDLDATISDQFDLNLEDLIMEYSGKEQEFDKLINRIYEDVSSSSKQDSVLKTSEPSNLKTKYANKIESGEIDPLETSFADFEAVSKNKEIDYKAVYSQMISEGRIDPTKTTYDEMILISKLFGGVDESEYKATYSKYIGTGEIDPSETTYDEIVSIAKIFNEINSEKDSTTKSSDTMEDIYQYLKKNVDDDNDSLLGDFLELKDSQCFYDFYSFAINMYDLGLDIEKIKYLLNRSYDLAESCRDYKIIADAIIESNSPQEWNEWAKELYKESESKVESVDDILNLADSIQNTLKDDNWTLELYQKAENLAEDFEDYTALTDNVSNDRYLGDKEWGKELFEKAKEKATDVSEFQSLIELLLNEDNFDDQEYGRRLTYEVLEKCDDFDDYLLMVEGTSENQELQKEMIVKNIAILESDEQKTCLFEEIEYSLEDDDPLKIDIENLNVQELQSKYNKPSTDELKKLYAAGIGSGEIDPIEVSFDSFEKNYGKSNTNVNTASTVRTCH